MQDDVRKLVKLPIKGRIEAIGFTRYSEPLLAGSDSTVYPQEPNGTYPVISYDLFNELYGRVLTVVDATFQEGNQKEAFKSLLKNEMSGWYDKSTTYALNMTKQAYNLENTK